MTIAPKSDDQKFNETLGRMLKTPPQPHGHGQEGADKAKPSRRHSSGQQEDQKRDRPKASRKVD